MSRPAPARSRTVLVAVVAAAVALVVGAVLAVVVTTGGGEDGTPTPVDTADTRRAAERDAALADGRHAVEVFNSLDHEHVEESLDRWESVATGDLLAELRQNRQQTTTRVTAAGSTSTGTVLDAALTDLDDEAGTARLIAALSVDVTVEGQAPATKRTRLTADLERTADGWQVSRIAAG